jgi:hypothetical protein
MPGPALTTASSVQCPHGGRAILTTTNTSSHAGTPMLLESDVHPVVGCTFFMGPNYSPCLTIEWSAGASALTIGGTKVLVNTSVGRCKSGAGAIQGVALVASTQIPVQSK